MSKKIFESKHLSMNWSYDLKKKIAENFSNRQLASEIDETIIPMIKESIARGLSPVAGKRMFDKYKNPKKYPADLKQSNKPNLYLSGDMLSAYKTKASKEPNSVSVGIHNDEDQDIRIRAKANNNGTEHIPARRFVPWAGEAFTRKITLETKKIFEQALSKALKIRRNK